MTGNACAHLNVFCLDWECIFPSFSCSFSAHKLNNMLFDVCFCVAVVILFPLFFFFSSVFLFAMWFFSHLNFVLFLFPYLRFDCTIEMAFECFCHVVNYMVKFSRMHSMHSNWFSSEMVFSRMFEMPVRIRLRLEYV